MNGIYVITYFLIGSCLGAYSLRETMEEEKRCSIWMIYGTFIVIVSWPALVLIAVFKGIIKNRKDEN